MKRLFALVAIIPAGSVSPVFGQGSVTEQNEFMRHCAGCHGEAADGKGPLVALFKEPVPDLTVLAQNNDGLFPFLGTMMIIDGRSGLRGHGGTMPIRGDIFEAEAVEKAGVYGAETIARGRLSSLVEYRATVQQD